MISRPEQSLLEQLEEKINVDVDTMNAAFVANLRITGHDMTSNPQFVLEALLAPENKELVERTIKEMPGAPWDDVHAVLTARFAKNVYPHISGRVLAQTLPSNSDNVEATVRDARRYAKAFKAEGIPNERFCIKIAMNGVGVEAVKILKKEGIATLATCLYGLPQALAASQLDMYAISLYFNGPAAQTEAQYWADVRDPAKEHPMAGRHLRIRRAYDTLAKKTGKKQPQMKTASFVTAKEVLSMVELGADHVTVGRLVLDDLQSFSRLPEWKAGGWKKTIKDRVASDPHPVWEGFVFPEERDARTAELSHADPDSEIMTKDAQIAPLDVDYTAEGVLDKYIDADEISRVGVPAALKRFLLREEESRVEIQRLQAALA